MRVAVDTTPLAQTRAGTARYLSALLERLERAVDVRRVAFRPPRPAALGDVLWYPALLPRAARGCDVLHCPTFRAPLHPCYRGTGKKGPHIRGGIGETFFGVVRNFGNNPPWQ